MCVIVAVPDPEPKIQHVVSHVLCIASANGPMYSQCISPLWCKCTSRLCGRMHVPGKSCPIEAALWQPYCVQESCHYNGGFGVTACSLCAGPSASCCNNGSMASSCLSNHWTHAQLQRRLQDLLQSLEPARDASAGGIPPACSSDIPLRASQPGL